MGRPFSPSSIEDREKRILFGFCMVVERKGGKMSVGALGLEEVLLLWLFEKIPSLCVKVVFLDPLKVVSCCCRLQSRQLHLSTSRLTLTRYIFFTFSFILREVVVNQKTFVHRSIRSLGG
jgi:hypothetical protein